MMENTDDINSSGSQIASNGSQSETNASQEQSTGSYSKPKTPPPTQTVNPKIMIRASRKYKDFGKPCNFVDKDAVENFSSGVMECRPFKDQTYDKSFAEQDIGIQSRSTTKDISSQTIQERPRNNIVQYQPRDLEKERRDEILASEQLCSFLKSIKTRYTDALQQNEVMDLFEDDFANLGEEDDQAGPKSITAITEYQSFSDLMYSKGKSISAISWMPAKHGMVAAACSETKSFDERIQTSGKPSCSYVLIWSFSDPINPQIKLESVSDIFSLRFNPSKPGLIAGGCHNGQVILWDISTMEEKLTPHDKENLKNSDAEDKESCEKAPTVTCKCLSSPASSHTAIVSDIHWLPGSLQMDRTGKIIKGYSKESHVFVSIAPDKRVMFWDSTPRMDESVDSEQRDERKEAELAYQKYAWTPIFQIRLGWDSLRQLGLLKIILCGDSRVFCSTEYGEILEADINSANENEIVKSVYKGHYGPVRALQRSPFFEDIILSVDVWTFCLWKEHCMKPMFTSRSAEGCLTTGCWSPSRPGVIYIGLIDGSIEVWDLLDHSHQPSVKVSIGSCQVSSMEFSPALSPQLLAVGDIQGILHIMQIPRRLSKIQYKENLVMQKFFDRQLAWTADVERRTSERAKETEKIQRDAVAKKEREEKLLKCCTWTKEMELEYQQYEMECRVRFGVPSPRHEPNTDKRPESVTSKRSAQRIPAISESLASVKSIS